MYPSNNPYANEVPVVNASDLAGQLDSSKVYVIAGSVDVGDNFIDIPEGGLTLRGLDTDVSSLSANGVLFGGTGAYTGRIKLIDMSISSPAVFALDNTGGPSATSEISCDGVNFVGCASLGEAVGYRQGLWSNVGVIFCDDGLTLSGAWSGGFASLSSIVLGMAGGTLFKAGTAFTMAGSFRSNMNALSLDDTGGFCDFEPANILTDGGFSMEGVRVNPNSNAFPNMPPSSTRAQFNNCKGTDDTYPGGEFIVTADGTTTIAAADTLYQITAAGVGNNLDWTTISNTNAIEYLSTQPISVNVGGSLSFSGGNNDQVGLQVRQWDESASAYVNIGPEYTATLNGGLLGTRAENLSFSATAKIDFGDRIEIWIKNKSDDSDISTLAGGEFRVTER